MLCSLSQPHSQCVGEGFWLSGDVFFLRRPDRKRSPPTPTELVVETETRYEIFFFFSDVGARAKSIAGLRIAETALTRSFSGGGTFKKGAARLPCITWPRRHQTGGLEMQIVPFAPVMRAPFSRETCEMTCSQISRLHPHTAIPGWFSGSDTFPNKSDDSGGAQALRLVAACKIPIDFAHP